jgi:iron(III) transport system substrate-binding protein
MTARLTLAATALLAAACTAGEAEPLRLYTSVTQETVDAVVAGFRRANPGGTVEVFRAPTGELAARIAAEQREGDLQADVLWLTDPLSMALYEQDGLLRSFQPEGAEVVPAGLRTGASWGTRILPMVVVQQAGLDPPVTAWSDLTRPEYRVMLPDPGFAGSALGVLGYLASAEGFGFYRALREAGATQVSSPGEVVTGVAEGRATVGITLEATAREAVEDGSPIEVVWPAPGGIAVYSPIAVVEGSRHSSAEAIISFVLSRDGQLAIAATGWQPVRDDVEWDRTHPLVFPDWAAISREADALLEEYRSIFGG